MRRRAQAGDVHAVEQHVAGAGRQLAGDEIEIGGLAGAVGPDDGGERAGLERGAHGVDGDVAAEADGEAARFQNRVRHAPP